MQPVCPVDHYTQVSLPHICHVTHLAPPISPLFDQRNMWPVPDQILDVPTSLSKQTQSGTVLGRMAGRGGGREVAKEKGGEGK